MEQQDSNPTSLLTAHLWRVAKLLALCAPIVLVCATPTSAVRETQDDPKTQPLLYISPLSDGRNLMPPERYPVVAGKGKERPVLTGGARCRFVLTHAGKLSTPISIDGLRVGVRNYISGRHEAYAYKLDGGIIGSGAPAVNKFHVDVSGLRVARAKQYLLREDGKKLAITTALDDNFFNNPQLSRISLQPQGQGMNTVIEVEIAPQRTGLYELAFEINYTGQGRSESHQSESFLVYYEED